MNSHIGKCHARPESCTERLKHRFLRGEAPGQALYPVNPVTDFIEFGLYEAAWEQRIARVVDPSLQFSDIHQIDTVAYDIQ